MFIYEITYIDGDKRITQFVTAKFLQDLQERHEVEILSARETK